MRGEQKPSGKTAKEYCQRFPNTPTMTLAKKLYKENSLLYTNLESARGLIKYYRGLSGAEMRKDTRDKTLLKTAAYKYNPFELPESESVKAKVFKLPTGIKKVLLISDLHIPYQDNKAIAAAMQDGIDEEVDCVFINGDAADFYQLSFHEKDPRKTSIPNEIQAAKMFFASLRKAFPKATIYYIPANHEHRLERYLRVKAPELLDMEEFRLDILFNCRGYDIIYLDYGTKVYFGK